MIVFHHNDLDGRMSAAIIHGWVGIKDPPEMVHVNEHGKAILGAMFIEMDYAKPIPWDKIKPNDQVWIVDFSFSPENMKKLFEITQDVTWIDHHVTAIEEFKNWPGKIRGIRQGGTAACVLTWKYIHWWTARGEGEENFGLGCKPGLEVPRAVAMIGDYDAWLHQIPDSTAFYEGCKLLDSTPGSTDMWELLTGEAEGVFGDGTPLPKRDVCGPIIEKGKAAIAYRDAYCKDMCDSYGFESEIDGIKCWFTNIYKFGSFGFADRMKKYPICAAGVYNGERWTISLYSTTVDVSVVCKNHGGGGHTGAAGFVTKDFPFVKSTFECL